MKDPTPKSSAPYKQFVPTTTSGKLGIFGTVLVAVVLAAIIVIVRWFG